MDDDNPHDDVERCSFVETQTWIAIVLLAIVAAWCVRLYVLNAAADLDDCNVIAAQATTNAGRETATHLCLGWLPPGATDT